ncbi:Amino acid/peptide transporter [Lysobacter dokdonensis DS-58]|uniref:Amino acid/peptide transporter n=1 Tax=Lysobacter dokdonensis DS-58 TaxID=1300345 RepID=A0A0A2WCZ1_9GAMM|nr:peptide MFS transporter [Lysobacter dokdonensis]KGQ18016.1 Amino acid/peptide transporter [Lysobacter dokdonensis DS-58]
MNSIAVRSAGAGWLKQPPGLAILFFTQMWEIFSYYGMRTLLVYYMTKQLLFSQQHASMVYGAYIATFYFTPILGGIVSDRWLGRKRSVIIGAVVMSFGHFLMASESLLYFALAAIALGNGLFLPSLPSQIDDLYAKDDPRRGSAYNFYYVGINVGGLLAPLVCGTLGELYGWHYGFGAAGVGMLAGLVIYTLGGRWLPPERPKAKDLAPADRMPLSSMKQRVLTLIAVGLCVMVFRGAYEQSGNTIALWADVGLDRNAGGFVIPMTWFQSLNPFLVIFLTPLLVAMWTKQANRGQEPAPAKKMAMGAFGVSIAFLLLALVDASAQGHAHWVWLAAFFVLFTAGELFILPIGLSLFARLAPAGYAATSIAAWYFASFGGNLLAGALGTLWSAMAHAAFFALMAGVAALAGVLLRLLHPAVVRAEAMNGRGSDERSRSTSKSG